MSTARISAPLTGRHTTAAANVAVVQTIAAVAGQQHRLSALSVSFTGATGTAELKVENGVGTTVFSVDLVLTAGATYDVTFPEGGLAGSINTAMIVTLAAGGAGAIGKVNTSANTL